MEKFIKEHKKFSFFVISAAVFYFLIAVPLEKLNSSIKNLENKEKRFERAVYSEKIIKDREHINAPTRGTKLPYMESNRYKNTCSYRQDSPALCYVGHYKYTKHSKHTKINLSHFSIILYTSPAL